MWLVKQMYKYFMSVKNEIYYSNISVREEFSLKFVKCFLS